MSFSTKTANEVVDAVNESGTAAKMLSTSFAEINRGVKQLAHNATRTQAASQKVHGVSDTLRELVGRYKVRPL